MTVKQLYHAVLIELNKENAPNVLLEEFNYFANKAVNLYVNKRYNIYDINQQTTDDLRVLKATTVLKPVKSEDIYSDFSNSPIATYYVTLPSDYLHMLNCICIYKVLKTWNCYDIGDTWRASAKRLTADAFSQVLDNFWNKPTHNRPYYYIHNINKSVTSELNEREYIPTENKDGKYIATAKSRIITYVEPDSENVKEAIMFLHGTDGKYYISKFTFLGDGAPENWVKTVKFIYDTTSYTTTPDSLPKNVQWSLDVPKLAYFDDSDVLLSSLIKDAHGNPIAVADLNNTYIKIGNNDDLKISNVERGASIRYGNSNEVRCEIKYGSDDRVFKLTKVYIDYIKVPQNIRLTVKQLDSTEDISLVLEYPDYVCQEILNELVHIIMENIGDLRLSTHPVVSLSIANPAQQLTETVAQPQ